MRNAILFGLAGIAVGVLITYFAGRDGEPVSQTEEAAPAPVVEDTVRWKMASTFAGSLTQLGSLGIRVQDQVEAVSDGAVQIKFFDPGALVPALEIFDAVSSGGLDAGWSTPSTT